MNYYILVVLAVIDILNFNLFSKARWYALEIIKKVEKRKFKFLKPYNFTWIFAKIKFAVYIAMAFAYWAGSNYGVGYNDFAGALKIIAMGVIVSCTFVEDLGYYIISKERIPKQWNHVWISNYIKRTPKSLIMFITLIGQIAALSIALA